jgi:hypothetical protein
MNPFGNSVSGRPTTTDEFIRCLIRPGWDPFVAFDEGSKQCLKLNAPLIREALKSLRMRAGLCRYTRALQKIVRVSSDDETLRNEWRANLPQLRALLYTSAFGTDRQRRKLLEIACNKQLTGAMRYALKQEQIIEPRRIEPTWIAVLYAEGSIASVREADRFNSLLDAETQSGLRKYQRSAG